MASRKRPTGDRLEAYRAKRAAGRTPEPFGGAAARPRLFVVQKHAATRLHHDFRLEWGGTLWSWAVPHGPSLDPAEKRLAVHVEDHPVEYADFEGLIPKGNYGAGPVIVWDRGVWVPYDDPDHGLATGKLHFELRGYKLKGVWTLVRTRRGPKEWLLIKKQDAWAAKEGTRPFDEGSILSGLTLDEMRDGSQRAVETRAALARLRAPRQRVEAGQVGLMLAETAPAPFSSPDWLFELKYDGWRLLAAKRADGTPHLRLRNGGDASDTFPDIARAVRALPFAPCVLDGEAVVLDEAGRPDFARLQQRARLRRRADIERAAIELPATLFVFDLLGFEAFDVRPLPLVRRKELLRPLLPASGPLRYADHFEARGEAMFDEVSRLGLEGIMAKRKESPYRAGRSGQWLKLPADRSGDFAVVGWSEPQGARTGLGALHLAGCDGEALVYVGRVGTGFDDALLAELRRQLEPLRQAQPPCTGDPPAGRGHFWVRPQLVAQVRYKTWTRDRHLRHPVFVRLRDDKRPEDCDRPGPAPARREPEPAPAAALQPAVADADRSVRFTNLDKLFWPRDKYTKGDLVEFYRTISPWLLPYLRHRPLVVTRYPDGIEGKSFYQKNAPDWVPSWVRTERIWSEHAQREIDYFVCDSEEMLLYVANSGAIPLHVWSSRVETLQHPDWCILDLDPKGAPFAHVVRLARAIGKLCDDIGLPAYPKTSGATGLHVLLPLGGALTYEQSRTLGHLVMRLVQERHPDLSTLARALSARGGKVYLDYLQNRHGQLLVAPFSVRPLPGASVSTPLRWSEVNDRLDPKQFTIRTVPERMRKLGRDPSRPVLDSKPDLAACLARLAARLDAEPAAARPRRKRSGG
jgi:bifunctional non-homologous end joining protein LigD